MADEQKQSKSSLSARDLPVKNTYEVQHRKSRLVVGDFGPNTYSNFLEEIEKTYMYSYSEDCTIKFREPTTSESISVCADGYEQRLNPKIENLKNRFLLGLYIFFLGRFVRVSEGVFANPPKDAHGNPITNEGVLMELLGTVEENDGICIVPDGMKKVDRENYFLRDFGFAPYKSFVKGRQDSDTFARGGLARLLEHTREDVARNLRKIASPEFFPHGVAIFGFHDIFAPFLGVARLQREYFDNGILSVGASDEYRYCGSLNWGGFACGVDYMIPYDST